MVKSRKENFLKIVSLAIEDFIENGYSSTEQLNFWILKIRKAAKEYLIPEHILYTNLKKILKQSFNKKINGKNINRIKTQLNNELEKSLFAASSIIKINREKLIEKSINQFSGWATSLPAKEGPKPSFLVPKKISYGIGSQGPVGQGPVGQGPVGQGPVGQGPVGQGPVGQGPGARSQKLGRGRIKKISEFKATTPELRKEINEIKKKYKKEVLSRIKTKNKLKKTFSQLEFEDRRVLIDQNHKLVSSINDLLARDSGAIAARWHSHWREMNYNFREEHKLLDDKIFVIRDNWAIQNGLMSKGLGFTDELEKPAQLPFCRCYYEYVYNLSDLPEFFLTEKGKNELNKLKGK
jgi:hypothetical protein